MVFIYKHTKPKINDIVDSTICCTRTINEMFVNYHLHQKGKNYI